MSGSMVEVLSGPCTTPRMGRRSMALSDIDPKYVSQSGIWEASEVETSRGSIRIQHMTATAVSVPVANSRASSGSTCGGTIKANPVNSAPGTSISRTNVPRFPKLEECVHFHYDCVELPQLKIQIRDDPSKPISISGDETQDKCAFSIEVVAGGQSWAIRRTHTNFKMLDAQLHSCVWDRTFSLLEKVQDQETTTSTVDQPQQHNGCREFVAKYLSRLNKLPTNKITCGTVLVWLELDNRGRHIVSSDDSAINTPAVAAACAKRKYVAQAVDEISFEVGEMISVIDMPPQEESIWWRGKREYQVGFFPRDYVQIIGDKVPAGLPIVPSVRKLQRLSVSSSSSASSASSSVPDKPVLRKHGKLISFFRSFILSRPSRRRLKQSGILRERVFSCDLTEYLLNTGNEIPTVLKCCADCIERHGIVDGVYRLSGVTSNIQKLRNAFDEDKIPNLEDLAIKQDIHAVSSLLKMYFRELPNPLCTYQLYEKFVAAANESDEARLFKMREVVLELPPPHYRTLEYLMKHLSRVAERSSDTGMTPKNMAIVWAPNLIRCRELEAGGVAALKGVGVQAVVTEYLIRHADLIFNDKLPANFPTTTTVLTQKSSSSGSRPKSLAISSPIKLMSLEEAQDKARDDRKLIDVGGGPASLPQTYHTVIDLPSRRGSGLKNKRSPMGWKNLFSRNRSFSKPPRRSFTPNDITVITRNYPVAGPQGIQTNWIGRLRPVKSVESLVSSSPLYNIGAINNESTGRDLDSESVMEEMETSLSRSSPATPITTDVMFHPPPLNSIDARSLQSKTHNRSISHDSYFEFGEFRNSNNVYIDETLEEETMSQTSKLSLDLSSSEQESNVTSPVKIGSGGAPGRSKSEDREKSRDPFKSPLTPPPSAASNLHPSDSYQIAVSNENVVTKRTSKAGSPLLSKLSPPSLSRPCKWRDSEVQTSLLQLSDVGVCTDDTPAYTRNSTRTKEKSVGVDSSTFVSMDDEFGRYELDKNSSFDESSEMSTPEEQPLINVSTNIVYSPLVNEMSSASSIGEHINLLQSNSSISSSTTSTKKQTLLHSNRSSNSIEFDSSYTTSSANVCLFVCPLYEAGVTAEDLLKTDNNASDESCVENKTVFVSGSSAVAVPDIQNITLDTTSVTAEKFQVVPNMPEPQYENDPAVHRMEEVANIPTQAKVLVPQKKEICHIYENDRIYQNEPVAPIRKRPVSLAVLNNTSPSSTPQTQTDEECHLDLQQSSAELKSTGAETEPSAIEQSFFTNTNATNSKPKAKEPLPSSCIDSDAVYTDRGEEHYENIHYEGNIYEDIDSEHERREQQDQGENKYSGGSSCRYEAVGIASPLTSSRENLNPADRSKENPTLSCPKDLPESSDDEYSANYESVRFKKVENKLVAHHYSEIEDKTATTSPEEEQSKSETDVNSKSSSTPSHSRTDDMVTYLEVQTPSFKLRTNSLEPKSGGSSEEQSSYERVGRRKNSETIDDDIISPEGCDDEIHFIDSPLVVENPVYSLEMEGLDPDVIQFHTNKVNQGAEEDDIDFEISMNESVSLSLSIDEDNNRSHTTPTAFGNGKSNQVHKSSETGEVGKRHLKLLLGRCNSAPLSDTKQDFVITDVYRQQRDENFQERPSSSSVIHALNKTAQQITSGSSTNCGLKIPLNKRMSEPLLSFSNSSNTLSIKTDENNATAWKLADAKRLANRKQSVKELLSKFESRDSTPSPTNNNSSSGLNNQHFNTLSPHHHHNKDTQGFGPGGLPKPVSQNQLKDSPFGRNNKNNAGNGFGGRFQHHRFSMGDILLSQPPSESDDLNSISSHTHSPSPKNSMVRSDTFPELRCSTDSKVASSSKENLDMNLPADRSSHSQGNLNETCQLVPEKVQNALRVAMSSVDMNDPNTRERIEKYKEERRSFLRQRITSEINLLGSEIIQKLDDEEKDKQPTSVIYPPATTTPSNFSDILSNQATATSVSSTTTISSTTRSNSCSTQVMTFTTSNNKSISSGDSPRKRAFSEDIPTPPFSNSYFTKTKSIKTEPEFKKYSEESSITKSSTTTTQEEINVKEKIALWTLQKKEMSKSTLSCAEIANNESSTIESTISHKPFVKPILRREVTTSCIEISKCKLNVPREDVGGSSGKKIKDIKDFFESKKF